MIDSNQIDIFEIINKRGSRFVTGNYKMIHGNTDKNMKSLDWSPLSQRRSKINQMIHYFEISDLRENQKLPFQPNKMMT